MTILGKILVFFVLILSLIWTGLTMNAFVTRTNWKNAHDAVAAELAKANTALGEQEKYYQQLKSASEVTLQQQREEINRLKQQVAVYSKEKDDATATLTAKLAAQQADDNPVRLLQNDRQKAQNQVDLLQKSQAELERIANEAVIARQKALDDRLQAIIDRDAARRRADDLEGKFLKLNDQLTGRAAGVGGESIPPVDEDFRATVTNLSGDQVEISLGANAGLQKGAVLSISRTKPDPKYVGQLKITNVDAYTAVGRFIPRSGLRSASGDDLPRKGDTVSVIK